MLLRKKNKSEQKNNFEGKNGFYDFFYDPSENSERISFLYKKLETSSISFFLGLIIFSMAQIYFWAFLSTFFNENGSYSYSENFVLIGFIFSSILTFGGVYYIFPRYLNLETKKISDENFIQVEMITTTFLFFYAIISLFNAGFVSTLKLRVFEVSNVFQALTREEATNPMIFIIFIYLSIAAMLHTLYMEDVIELTSKMRKYRPEVKRFKKL